MIICKVELGVRVDRDEMGVYVWYGATICVPSAASWSSEGPNPRVPTNEN